MAAPGLGDGAMEDVGVGEPRAEEDGEGGEGGGAGVKVEAVEVVAEDEFWDVLRCVAGGAVELLENREGVDEDVAAAATGVEDFVGGGVGCGGGGGLWGDGGLCGRGGLCG